MKKSRMLKAKNNLSESRGIALEKLLNKVLYVIICSSICVTQLFAAGVNAEVLNEELLIANMNQEKTVSGTVSDENGPLVGVNITVKGTTVGTMTDFDGNYSIEVENDEAILVFSYIGYLTKEIVVGNQSVLDVILATDIAALDEVVVLGYTTRKRGDVTGSVSTLKAEVIEQAGNKDLAKSLAGKVSGLIISDRGGYPGGTGDITLLIRGKSTLGNNAPLVLIDGIATGSFSHLAPQDIESLTVLKDGAAAIYGARAANGVILITTKRGKSGKPKINLSTSYNLSGFSAQPSLMNSEEFAIYTNEIEERFDRAPIYSQDFINELAAGNGTNTNWQEETFDDYSPESRTSLSISGGGEDVNYFVSADNISQTGLYKSGDLEFKQNQVRSNLDINVFEDFKVGVDLSGRFGKNLEPGVNQSYIYKHIYTNSPLDVAVYPNGLPGWGGENGSNPVIMSSDESGFVKRISNDLRGKFSLDWKLDKLTEGLRFKGFVGIRRMNNDEKSWYTPWTYYDYDEGTDEYTPMTGFSQNGQDRILRESFWKFDELMLNATVHYAKTIGDDHNFSGFVGYEQMTSEQRNFYVEKRGFPTADHSDLFAGDVDGQQSDGYSQEWARVNYFGSLSYDYMKKYFVDLTLRHDGSSAFGPGKRFGTFPGIALSWSIDKESFMEKFEWIDALKLRTSWAKMGNDRIAGFQYLTSYNYAGNLGAQPNYYIFGDQAYNGFSSLNVPAANPDITWESADMKNIGLNFTVLNNRLTGDFNYFYQKRDDILWPRNASIPDFAGLTLPQENIGKVDNYGWELELGWNDKAGAVDYNVGFNFTQAKNEVKYLDEAVDVPDALKREGHPMDSYIIYPTNGIFADQAQVDAAPATLPNTVEGEPYYIDTNEDGVINAEDRVRTYYSNVPEIQYGIFGGLNYKNWNFNFLFQGQAEAKALVFFEGNGALPDFLFDQRWTPENRNARYPRAFTIGDPNSTSLNGPENFQGADLWLRDASYLRLKEVELGYTFTKDVVKFGDVKVYFRGTNLLTMFSDIYDLGLDPEAGGYNSFRSSRYPSLKTFTFGLNLNF